MRGPAWVAIDGGQSTTRLRASWRADELTGPGYVHHTDRAGAMLITVTPLLDALGETPPVDVVAIGHTGFPPTALAREHAAREIARRTGARTVLLAPDWATAHLGALAGGPGVVLSVGTGTAALGLDAAGIGRRVDGWGYLLGDAGSGFALGQAGLRTAMRDLDGRTHAPALAAAARDYLDDPDMTAVTLHGRDDRVDAIARFAQSVLMLAEAGDPPAKQIVEAAAVELARTAAAAGAHLHPPDNAVSVVGRLVAGSPLLAAAFADALAQAMPGADLRAPQGSSLDGAARLAVGDCDRHRQYVDVYEEPPG